MRASFVIACVLLVGCEGEMPEPSSFIALERDFANYTSWEFVDAVTSEFDATEGTHVGGARRIYLSARPPEGATAWPVGTMFVKEMNGEVLAMAKRGGTFNANGAVGWEWFELERDVNTAVRIRWRGLGPPLGTEGRYSHTGQGCNTCHATVPELDGVLSPGWRILAR